MRQLTLSFAPKPASIEKKTSSSGAKKSRNNENDVELNAPHTGSKGSGKKRRQPEQNTTKGSKKKAKSISKAAGNKKSERRSSLKEHKTASNVRSMWQRVGVNEISPENEGGSEEKIEKKAPALGKHGGSRKSSAKGIERLPPSTSKDEDTSVDSQDNNCEKAVPSAEGEQKKGEYSNVQLDSTEESKGDCVQVIATETKEDPAVQVSDYERMRDENIRRNKEFLASLGIEKTHFGPTEAAPKKSKKKRKPKPRDVVSQPLRRSSRKRGLPAEKLSSVTPKTVQEESEEEVLDFDDSSVVKYSCTDSTGGAEILDFLDTRKPYRSFTGVRRIGSTTFVESSLKKIYSIDFAKLDNRLLVAAAGDKGNTAIYGVENLNGSSDEEEEEREPLFAFRAHKRWIGGMQFLPQQNGECPLLITSSDDGGVILWDISKQATSKKHGVQPKTVCSSYDLHSAGIFSLHACGNHFATGSKDTTVSWAQIAESDIKQVVSLEHHSHVVKTVRSRDEVTVASAGNDLDILVWDTRDGKSPSTLIESAHDRTICSIAWHPNDKNLILSAAADSNLHLFDLRNVAKPLYTFVGHTVADGKFMYQPVFLKSGLRTGRASVNILTGGKKTAYLSMYCASTGDVISRGGVDMEYNSMAAYHGSDNMCTTLIAAAAKKYLHLFTPTTE